MSSFAAQRLCQNLTLKSGTGSILTLIQPASAHRPDQTAEPITLQLAQEVDHRGIDRGSTLLLGPMPAAGKHYRAAQPWHVIRQIGDGLIHVAKRHHQIAVAGHVDGGHGHFGAGKRG